MTLSGCQPRWAESYSHKPGKNTELWKPLASNGQRELCAYMYSVCADGGIADSREGVGGGL